MACIYNHSTRSYGDVKFPLRWGIEEGCPLSPSLFVLVYEAFHSTLAREFPAVTVLAYVDNMTIIALDNCETQKVLTRVDQLSTILGLHTNAGKT